MSTSFHSDFADFGNHCWFNTASEGPLPVVSAQALQEAIGWKSKVYQLDLEKFQRVPHDLKQSIAKLINVSERDVILANSVSYGIHLLANGIAWKAGDEILLMQNDFPTDILPWLALEKKGVVVRQLKPQGLVLTPSELESQCTHQTRLVCLPHVHSFSGAKLLVEEIAAFCRKREILFVLNVAQTAGNIPIDLSFLKVDAVVAAGYKWLCGPYGTGFCWMTPELRQRLDINLNYWISTLTDEELQTSEALHYKKLTSSRVLDVFGTANFFNFVPFKASIDYFLHIGLDIVETYNQELINHFLEGLNPATYDVISPKSGPGRSNLVVFSHRDPNKNKTVFGELNKENIYLAHWKGNLRFAPHIFNQTTQVTRLLKVLEQAA